MTNVLTIPPDAITPMQTSLDQGLHTFEKVLNVAGYIPIVSSVSGSFRILFGKLEVIAAIALGVFLILKAILFSANAEQRSRQIDYGVAVMLNYALHGVANIGRGLVESAPILVNNLACGIYDLTDNRIKYPCERV